jgi:uncharacterized protein with ATP-grasp and redox domains
VKSSEIFLTAPEGSFPKGQGNLEGLLDIKDKRIFFLLMVKCNVMAEFLNVEKNSFVVFNPSMM